MPASWRSRETMWLRSGLVSGRRVGHLAHLQLRQVTVSLALLVCSLSLRSTWDAPQVVTTPLLHANNALA